MKLRRASVSRRGFTLLEVMIAIAIFFVGSFAILDLISASLSNARRLQKPSVDASPVLATWMATNSWVEGHFHGSLGDENMLGKAYNDYVWDLDIVEISSNHLYGAVCTITSAGGKHDPVSRMTTVAYKPASPPGSLDGAIGMKGH
jgi:prepilin-type N-terminal cleavage/methylation domain-containing protein